jgi:poly-gamma-glutamate synthase PgsB/CapB
MTNVRLDHTDAMGNTLEQIASVFSQDIPEKAIVFIPENENFTIFSSAVDRKNGQLFRVASEMSHRLKAYNFSSIKNEFSENIDLAYAVAKYLDIDDRVIAKGIDKAKHDIGHLKIWKFYVENKKKNLYFVNGFAANDPQSTLNLIAKIKEDLSFSSQRIYGFFNSRSDRAERTLQWIQFLQSDAGNIFSQLFICGPHAPIVRRKLKIGLAMKHHSPEKILEIISEIADDQSVIFGFGNIAGMGRKIIDDLNRIGVEYGV